MKTSVSAPQRTDVYSPLGRNFNKASMAVALLLKFRPAVRKKCGFSLSPRSLYAWRAAFASRCTSEILKFWPRLKSFNSGFLDSLVRPLTNFLKRFVRTTTLEVNNY